MASERTVEMNALALVLLAACLTLAAAGCSGSGAGDDDAGDDDGPTGTCYDERAMLGSGGSAFENSFGLDSDGSTLFWTASRDKLMRVAVAGGDPQLVGNEPCNNVFVAGGYVYWQSCPSGTNRGIMRSSVVDGTTMPATPADVQLYQFIAVGAALYWSDTSGIHRKAHDSAETTLVGPATRRFHTDGESVCWLADSTDGTSELLLCSVLSQPGTPATIRTASHAPGMETYLSDIVVDQSTIYWIEQREFARTLHKASVTGGQVTELATVGEINDLEVHGDRLYWLAVASTEGQPDDLYMMPKSGGAVTAVVANVDAYTVDACHVYWFERGATEDTLYRQAR